MLVITCEKKDNIYIYNEGTHTYKCTECNNVRNFFSIDVSECPTCGVGTIEGDLIIRDIQNRINVFLKNTFKLPKFQKNNKKVC